MRGDTERVSVLLVEDHQGVREFLVRLLDQLGYEVVAVEGESEALRRIRQRTFDLVLSDYSITDGNGLDLLRSARELLPNAGLVLMSSSCLDDALLATLSPLGARFIEKPFATGEPARVLAVLMVRGSEKDVIEGTGTR